MKALGVVLLFGVMGLLTIARPLIAWGLRNRRLNPVGPVYVNLGSGLEGWPGWINIDGGLSALIGRLPAWFRRSIHACTGYNGMPEDRYVVQSGGLTFHDLRYGVPLADNTADYIYSSHFLEHLYREDAERLIKDAYRALRPGGHIRIAVPDLRRAFDLYQAGRKEEALRFFFVGRGTSSSQHHRWMYDINTLCELLENAGFSEVKESPYRSVLDNRPDKTVIVVGKKEKPDG